MAIAGQASRQPSADHIEDFCRCIRTRKKPNADIEDRSTLLSHYGNIRYGLGGRKLTIDSGTEKAIDSKTLFLTYFAEVKTGLRSSNSQQSSVKGITFTIVFLLVLALGSTSFYSTPLPADDVAASDLVVGTEAGLPPVIGDSKGSGSQVVPSLSRQEVAWYSCPRFPGIRAPFHQTPSARISSFPECFPLRI